MDITPENALSVQHAEWLSHPVTRQMLQILDKQRENTVGIMSKNSGSSESPDTWFRLQAGNVRTLDTVRIWITNTEQFINLLNNK